MSFTVFLSGVMALLLAPGPTNTLIALSAASSGFRKTLRLIPAELAGYLVTVLPLAGMGAALLTQWPATRTALTVLAALWVMALALRLWRQAGATAGAGQIAPTTLFCTTVLNPKALVFGLVLLPPVGNADFPLRLAAFAAAVVAAAVIWSAGGALLGGAGRRPAPSIILHRVAAGWLGLVSLTLVSRILST